MSESKRISVSSIQTGVFLISVFVLSSFSAVSAQNSGSSSGIANVISIFRNSSAGKKSLPVLTVLPRSLRIYSGEGGTSEMLIISNSNWILKCNERWISADRDTGGGYNIIVLTVKENPEYFERIARITVSVKGLPVRIIELSQKARHDE